MSDINNLSNQVPQESREIIGSFDVDRLVHDYHQACRILAEIGPQLRSPQQGTSDEVLIQITEEQHAARQKAIHLGELIPLDERARILVEVVPFDIF